MHLLLSQKNILFKLIESHDLDPNDFKLREYSTPTMYFASGFPGTEISYHNTKSNFYYKVYETLNGHNIEFTPGKESLKFNRTFMVHAITFDAIKVEFTEWLESLHREVNEINLWEELESFSKKKIFQEFDFRSTEKFDQSEKKYLKENLRLLKQQLLELKFLKEHSNLIEAKLDDLTVKVDHLNKFDWFTYFVGVITSIVITWSVTPEQGSAVFELVKSIFGKIRLITN